MPGDTFLPKHTPPETSWWATPMSYAAWSLCQREAQKRFSKTGRPGIPGGPDTDKTLPRDDSAI